MLILVCPGFNQPQFNESFLQAFVDSGDRWLLYPSDRLPPYSPAEIVNFWFESVPKNDHNLKVMIIGFSAGVVAIESVALSLSKNHLKVQALIAIDGWGVPLWGEFPTYRVSHDYFTHWSSSLLGKGDESFYAYPGVEHLELWRSPQTAYGWKIAKNGQKTATTALKFIEELLSFYRVLD